MEPIVTERLTIVALNLELVDAAIARDETAFRKLGYLTNGLWPQGDLCDALPFFRDLLTNSAEPDFYGAWIIAKKMDGTIIGDIGFKGPPDESGAIEIGFSVIPKERRNAYCIEAARALIARAFTLEAVRSIVAECLVTNHASRALLKKLDFKEAARSETAVYLSLTR